MFQWESLQRNFKGGWKDPLRLYGDQSYELEIAFHHTQVPEQVVMYTNISGQYKSRQSISWKAKGKNKFSFLLKTLVPGSYAFHLQFKVGEVWIKDQIPPTRVLVDPSEMKTVVMYSLIPGYCGDFSKWKPELERAKAIGCNTIHFLPIVHKGSSGSPYSAYDPMAIDPEYASTLNPEPIQKQWEEVVKWCKDLKLKLCIDLVLNHISIESPLVKENPHWFVADPQEVDGIKRAGWWAGEKWMKWEDLALLNFNNSHGEPRKDLWEYLLKYAIYWGKFAADTGGFIRLDNFHSCDHAFTKTAFKLLREKFPQLGIFTEFFAPPGWVARLSGSLGINMQLATPWEDKFVPQLRGLFKYVHQEFPRQRFLTPITSHDSGSPAQEFGTSYSTYPRYALSALGGTGATGLVQGVEFGYEARIEFIKQRPQAELIPTVDFSPFIRKINKILCEFPDCFATGGNIEFIDHDHPAVLAFIRYHKESKNDFFLVILNFDTNSSQEIQLGTESLWLQNSSVRFVEIPWGGRNNSKFSTKDKENHWIKSDIFGQNCVLQPCDVLIWQGKK